MTDPRKTVRTLPPADQTLISKMVHKHLLAATAAGARDIGTTGASFVLIGMGVWAAELSELDGRATAKYLRSLADIFDPTLTSNRKVAAEKKRAQAVRALLAALDLEMSEVSGHG